MPEEEVVDSAVVGFLFLSGGTSVDSVEMEGSAGVLNTIGEVLIFLKTFLRFDV